MAAKTPFSREQLQFPQPPIAGETQRAIYCEGLRQLDALIGNKEQELALYQADPQRLEGVRFLLRRLYVLRQGIMDAIEAQTPVQ